MRVPQLLPSKRRQVDSAVRGIQVCGRVRWVEDRVGELGIGRIEVSGVDCEFLRISSFRECSGIARIYAKGVPGIPEGIVLC